MNGRHNGYYDQCPYRMIAMQDDADCRYMLEMYPHACQAIYRHSVDEILQRERMGQLRDNVYPPRSVVDDMIRNVYDRSSQEFLGDWHDSRQFYSDREGIFRDLVAVILLAELFGRRRRRRRRYYTGF